MSRLGYRTESAIVRWYDAWRRPGKARAGALLLVCLVLFGMMAIPGWEGEGLYLGGEETLKSSLEERGWYSGPTAAPVTAAAPAVALAREAEPEPEPFALRLVVSGTTNGLLVRDAPSVENGMEINRVPNGDAVSWLGQIAFEQTGGLTEAWLWISDAAGAEGWARSQYLGTEEYGETEFLVRVKE